MARKPTVLLVALTLVVTGCGAPIIIRTSDVTPAGSGNYLVVAKPSDNTDWSDIRIKALTAADAYCVNQGRKMEQVNVDTHGTSGWGQQEYELTFRCTP